MGRKEFDATNVWALVMVGSVVAGFLLGGVFGWGGWLAAPGILLWLIGWFMHPDETSLGGASMLAAIYGICLLFVLACAGFVFMMIYALFFS